MIKSRYCIAPFALLLLTRCALTARAAVLSVETSTTGNKHDLVAIELSPPAGSGEPNRRFTYQQLIRAEVVDYLSIPENNAANTISVLCTPEEAPPVGTDRLTLISDSHLNTGILNPSASSPGLAVSFARPLVNGPGEDLVIFELTIGNGQTPDPLVVQQPGGVGVARNVQTNHYQLQGVIPAEATPYPFLSTVDNGGAADLNELTTGDLSIGSVTNPKWHAVAINLSVLGVAANESVSAIEILSGDATRAADLLFVAGLPLGTLRGDYDVDGDVDGDDFLIWQRALGSVTEAYTGAEGSGNGIIDSADYELWRANFAIGGGAAIATYVAPEPRALAIVGVAFVASCLLRAERRSVRRVNVTNNSPNDMSIMFFE
jgi:hypothetical protein